MIKRLFGYIAKRFLAPAGSGAWLPIIREASSGAWQRGEEINQNTVLAYSAVFACVSLIASDISKMRLKLVERNFDSRIWTEIERASPFLPVFRKPNRYQNRIQFYEQWVISLLVHGNAFILKQRDARGVVVAMYVLNPFLVQTLVAEDGGVYYQISRDPLNQITPDSTVIPASEIMHGRINCLWHPLVGVSPIYACGLAAMQGRRIQEQSTGFFRNKATPSGVLTAPGTIKPELAEQLRLRWEQGYGGANAGKVAVLGDGLKFEQITMSAVDSQLIEQLRWTAEDVARAFRVPGYKIGVGTMPAYNNIAALDQQYYSQCLQSLIEGIELSIDEGLGLTTAGGRELGAEFDTRDLIRMDPEARYKVTGGAIKEGWLSPNEGRQAEDLPPVEGGETPYMQQQNYSLAALARRDEMSPLADPIPSPQPDEPESPTDDAETERALLAMFRRNPEDLFNAA